MTTITAPKKATIATVKSFIKKNAEVLYTNVKSSFSGMTDCVESYNGGFSKAVATTEHMEHTMGLQAAWFVGQSRDYIKPFNEDGFEGFRISNNCGCFIIAIKK